MFSEWINALKTFPFSVGIKITIRLRKRTHAECLGCFRKKGGINQILFWDFKPPFVLISQERWWGQSIAVSSMSRMGQESDCWGISKAVVKQYNLHKWEVLWPGWTTLHLLIKLLCLDINSPGQPCLCGQVLLFLSCVSPHLPETKCSTNNHSVF